jgi:predicted RecB family nuclease
MRLIASDLIVYYRPSKCDLRVFLRQKGDKEREPSIFDELLRRLGLTHEKQHLSALSPYVDLSCLSEKERIKQTIDAIAKKAAVLYQPMLLVKDTIAGTEVEIVGQPDFLILDDDAYIIRDTKISRRIDDESHPEILLQVQLYGWMLEKSSGTAPKALQVHNGANEIVTVPYDRGVAALAMLEHLLAIKQLPDEPYEPVGWSKCNGCDFHDKCWAKAESNADVAIVYGVDQNLARKLHDIGICSRTELLAKFDVTRLSEFKRPVGNVEKRVGKTAERIIQFADAMEGHEEKVLSVPAIRQSQNYVMFDLEGMPPHLDELGKVYLWGTQVFGAKPSEFMPAVAGFGANGDKDGWLDFLAIAKRIFQDCGDIPFVHWAAYEEIKLGVYMNRYGDVDGIAARVVANLLNLLEVAQDSIVLPLPSYSLKVIEKYVGYKRKQEEYGGSWAMAMFIEATETNEEEKRKQLMDKIVAYNQEDLEAMWAVFKWLEAKTPAPN